MKTFGWDARPSPKPVGNGKILTGRGISYTYRGQTVIAQIAEVEVNRETGRVGHACREKHGGDDAWPAGNRTFRVGELVQYNLSCHGKADDSHDKTQKNGNVEQTRAISKYELNGEAQSTSQIVG